MLSEPRIVIRKSLRRLELFAGDRLVHSYPVALGSCPLGHKQLEGDGRTPEGEYYVSAKNPESKFHLSLCLSYPSIPDARRGLDDGLIAADEYDAIIAAVTEGKTPPQKTRLGGEIYIHGGGTDSDWTQGCVALIDSDIADLYSLVPVGTPVAVLP